MDNLKLIQRIAEIESLRACDPDILMEFRSTGDYWYISSYNTIDGSVESIKWFNPLTDKALLWDLMVKYNVDIIWMDRVVQCGHHDFLSVIEFENDDDLPRAILECIVKSKEK